jgi:hypothetical protein
MESMGSLDNQPSISCGFVETMQLPGGYDTLWKTLCFTYTEEVAWFIG